MAQYNLKLIKTLKMNNLIKITSLTLLLIIFFTFSISAVEKKPGQAASKGIKSEISKPGFPLTKNLAFKNLSFKEKHKLMRDFRKEIKKSRKVVSGTPKWVLYILAVIIPPVAVGIFTDWGKPTLWNLLFTLLFWVPGIIHAFYILLR
jgi:uncharacterized membrane protein YqaE (UPF0057 family)